MNFFSASIRLSTGSVSVSSTSSFSSSEFDTGVAPFRFAVDDFVGCDVLLSATSPAGVGEASAPGVSVGAGVAGASGVGCGVSEIAGVGLGAASGLGVAIGCDTGVSTGAGVGVSLG